MLAVCCFASAQLFAQLPQATYDLTVDDCGDAAFVCTEISAADFPNLTVYIDGVAQAGTRLACDEDTITSYILSNFNGDGFGGPFELFEWTINGVNQSGTFTSPTELAALMNAADPGANWRHDLVTNRISGGLSANDYSDLEVFCVPLVANQVAARQTSLQGGGSRFAFAEGSHDIEVHDASGLLDAATVNVTCTAVTSYEYVGMYIPGAETVCPDLGALNGPVAQYTVDPNPTSVALTLSQNDCFAVTPLRVGIDTVTVTYCDAAGNCATANYIFDVELGTQITSSTYYDTVPAPGGTVTYCLDTLELPGIVTSAVNVCPEASGTYVNMELVEQTLCVKYRGLTVGGTDTACIVVCDDLGFCDTTTVIVTTGEPSTYPDQDLEFTIEEGTVSSTLLNLQRFVSPVAGFTNVCPDNSGTFVEFRLQPSNYSVDFTGLAVGRETACVEVFDEEGRTQMINIAVNVRSRAAASDTIRIRRGDDRTWCFGPYELTSDPIEMFNDCPPNNPHASVAQTADLTCWQLTGERVGVQRMCVTLCDGFGICDRVNLVVEVVPGDDDRLPVAVDDYFVIDPTGPAVLDVLANDSSRDPITFAYVYGVPAYGTATFAAGDEIVYTPDAGTCEVDKLLYEICNDFGCDQAEVIVVNDCEGTASKPQIINRSGFTPNGDGVNETWVLTNIEYYPNNNVKVYNRWGSRVLEEDGYANGWAGDFDGAPLPDGTYFFVVDPGEAGVQPVAGYVQLRR